ncbi:MAG TPA: FHA domain-containing protein, partial [Isosphaeraceae bacterium]|nr:FHA domain-containing protein [Isosphaeraceae bacterium]
MSTDPPDRRAAGLILRVLRPVGPLEEIYVTDGLTIGRSEANAVVLDDREATGRAHARIDIDPGGVALVRCQGPDIVVATPHGDVRELPLGEGTRFRIGRTDFECVGAGSRVPEALGDMASGCPFCGAVQSNGPDVAGPRPCVRCGEPVLAIPPTAPGEAAFVVPIVYGAFRALRFAARGGMGLVLEGAASGGT